MEENMNRWKDWYEQALRDLEAANVAMINDFHEWACFIAQQAAEKMVKALAKRLGYDIWGHSITMILKEIPVDTPDDITEAANLLDTFYILTRYPNGFDAGKPGDYFSKKRAEEALEAARKIVRYCEGILFGQGENN